MKKNYFLKLISIISLSAFLSACSNATKINKNIVTKSNSYQNFSVKDFTVKEQQKVQQVLLSNFEDWKNVKYKWGGTTKKGVDCSAFIGHVYRNGFGLNLPRTTFYLKEKGQKVSKNKMLVGDMVFFRKNKHVGIYIGNGKFIHASTKKGVIESDLTQGYYAKAFTQARRIL